jgi:hypothetical protein
MAPLGRSAKVRFGGATAPEAEKGSEGAAALLVMLALAGCTPMGPGSSQTPDTTLSLEDRDDSGGMHKGR